MKFALLVASVAAFAAGFGCASAQVNERREAPVAAPGQPAPDVQRYPRFNAPPAPQMAAPGASAPETTGRSSNRDAAPAASSYEELKSAAEARRVRAAVEQTLDRARELSREGSE